MTLQRRKGLNLRIDFLLEKRLKGIKDYSQDVKSREKEENGTSVAVKKLGSRVTPKEKPVNLYTQSTRFERLHGTCIRNAK